MTIPRLLSLWFPNHEKHDCRKACDGQKILTCPQSIPLLYEISEARCAYQIAARLIDAGRRTRRNKKCRTEKAHVSGLILAIHRRGLSSCRSGGHWR